MSMDENEKKQQLSIAYLHAVASVAGYACQAPAVDDDSVDRTLVARGWVGTDAFFYSPRIDVQLKSFSRAALTRGEQGFSYELRKKNYDELRPATPLVPRLLVVLLLPNEREDWLSQGDGKLVVRHAAYFLSLCGMPDREDILHAVTVEIPRKNLLSVKNLQRLMNQVAQGLRRLQ